MPASRRRQEPVRRLPAQRGRRGALQVHELLREDILWLRVEPGSALDEVALAERFEVSRTPIREALLLLAGEGFVKFLPNRTTVVAPMTMDNAGDYLDTLLILSRAVARSAAMSGCAETAGLHDFIRSYSDAVEAGDHEAALKADHAFQRRLASLSGNMFQNRFFDQILDAGVRMRVLHHFVNATHEELVEAAGRMGALADAVIDGDPDRSDACMTRMIAADIAVIARSLEPRFGHDMEIGAPCRA